VKTWARTPKFSPVIGPVNVTEEYETSFLWRGALQRKQNDREHPTTWPNVRPIHSEAEMLNLKTIKSHTLKAHLDRIQNTAEELAAWSAGEVLAGRLTSCQEVARLSSFLLNIRAAIELAALSVRTPDQADN
jgi:hypothetical protein